MIKPCDCETKRIAEYEAFIDGELVRKGRAGESLTVVLQFATDAIRERLAAMYAPHWELTHGYLFLTGEHWMTFEFPDSNSLDHILIDGVAMPLRDMPRIDGEQVTLVLRLFKNDHEDWLANWAKIRDRIPAKSLDLSGYLPVSHPVLSSYGIPALLFTERRFPLRDDGDCYSVTIKGIVPKRVTVETDSTPVATV
jgi:hypothetical protein